MNIIYFKRKKKKKRGKMDYNNNNYIYIYIYKIGMNKISKFATKNVCRN